MEAIIKNKNAVAQATLEVDFELKEDTNFKPGQYLVLDLINPPYTDSKGNERVFSIISPPEQKKILSITTRLRDSAFKRSLNEMPIGTKVEINSIGGSFVLPDETTKPLVFLAGGIGITPFIGMLRHIKARSLPHKITLIYSNKNQKSALFLNELKEMADENKNFKLILTMTQDDDWKGEKRHIDTKFIGDYLSGPGNYLFFSAGPPAMVVAMYKILTRYGVKPQNIKTENFSGY